MIKKLVYKPLVRLTKNVSDGIAADADVYGSDRNDEIGELARAIQKTYREQQRQEHLLNAVNSAAAVLLDSEDKEDFEASLLEGMDLIGSCVGVDRVQIWRNKIINGELHFSLLHQWLSKVGQEAGAASIGLAIPYSETPQWDKRFAQGEGINSPVSVLPLEEQKAFGPYAIKSVVIFPLIIDNQFWGFFSLDECHSERTFSDDEINILRSGCLMMVTAVNRHEQVKEIERRDELLRVVNSAASVILCAQDEKDFDTSLQKGMDLMGRCVDVDYLEIWQNEAADGELYAVLKHKWFSGYGLEIAVNPPIERFPYSASPDWLARFSQGECIHGPICDLSPKDQRFLAPFKLQSTVILPLFLQNQLWGFACIDDCRNERYFHNGEVDILRSGCLMMVSAVNRNNQALQISQANRAKTTFLANMSHEMRTPLNAVIGLSELTLEAGGLSEDALFNLEKISNAGATLLSTVNDILDISKIEAGKFELMPVEYDVPSLINDAITQSIMRIGEKPIKFTLDIEESLPARLYGDDLRIKQIFNNLLSNAFKYTEEGTVELKVRCSPVQEDGKSVWVTASVSDTGRGIRKEDIDKLFSDYTMMQSESTRAIEGTGLGLPIAKNVAQMMGGSIYVESIYGKGSIFTVKLMQQFVSDVSIGPDVVNSLNNFRYSDQKRRRHSGMMRVTLPYARVLVVDDVATNLDVARGMMKPYGMQIDCASSGHEAIEAIRREKVTYNAVFMDHMMPGMDGIEATKIIREDIGTEYAKTVPIIALTANAIVGNESMFLDNGFNAFISKPIEIERLDSVIREWVRDKELEKELEHVNVSGTKILDTRSGQDRRRDSDRRSGFDRRVFGQGISGLDIGKGLKSFGGSEEIYLEILQSYIVGIPPLLDKARSVTRENLEDYVIVVHGIKGSSFGICAESIGNQAQDLEHAAKEGDWHFITTHNADFIEAAGKLIDNICELFPPEEQNAQDQNAEKPDSGLLARLMAACEQGDIDAVDAVMEEIESFKYTDDEDLVSWLREHADQMQYKKMAEKLKNVF